MIRKLVKKFKGKKVTDDDVRNLDVKEDILGIMRRGKKRYAGPKKERGEMVGITYEDLPSIPYQHMLWAEDKFGIEMVMDYDFTWTGVTFTWFFKRDRTLFYKVGPFNVSDNERIGGKPGLTLEKLANKAMVKFVAMVKDERAVTRRVLESIDWEGDILSHMVGGNVNIVGSVRRLGAMKGASLISIGNSLCLGLQWVRENRGFDGTAKVRVTTTNGIDAGLTIKKGDETLKEVDIPVTDKTESPQNFGGKLQDEMTKAVRSFVWWSYKKGGR